MSEITATLAELPLLKGLGSDVLEAISQAGALTHLKPGDLLFQRGDQGDTFSIVLSGELQVRVGGASGNIGTITLAPIMPGEIVGELALLADVPRSADVIAATESSVLLFDRIHALALLGTQPLFARRLMSQIATRLAHVALTTSEQQESSYLGMNIRTLKDGAETAFQQALGELSTHNQHNLMRMGIQTMDTFQCGRQVVTVWTSRKKLPSETDLFFGYEDMQALSALFEDQPAEQRACTLIHHWQNTQEM